MKSSLTIKAVTATAAFALLAIGAAAEERRQVLVFFKNTAAVAPASARFASPSAALRARSSARP